jgi:hypothetical protein
MIIYGLLQCHGYAYVTFIYMIFMLDHQKYLIAYVFCAFIFVAGIRLVNVDDLCLIFMINDYYN